MSGNDSFISFFRPSIGKEEIREVTECLESGWLTTGKRSKQFETDFASYMGAKYAVAMNSCTAALHLALEAVGLKENEIVLVPAMTFAATAEVVRYFNAIPVLVDCNEDDFCMNMQDAAEILRRIKKGKKVKGLPEKHGRARAIIPVHFGGQVADVIEARKLCGEYDLKMVEDCAHCCPAYYKDEKGDWQMAGRSADIACFSFYANKTITTGEGGMALTDNEKWADRMRVMCLHGISKDAWKRFTKAGSWYYEITAPGFKYNMPDTAASIGIHQLKKADRFWEERKKISATFSERLSGIPGITLPVEKADRKHSWHLYPIRIDGKTVKTGRNEFIEKMKEYEIGTSVHYMPLHMHPYYKKNYGFKEKDFPTASKIFEQTMSLPLYPGLTEGEINRICEAVRKIAAL
ncbi:MAG: UDP-4-amino-4,6-dideoxy-N-acetyl-beta-L-altrosamine transaminase [Lentisphaerae bacterium GWF2_44_16]|nr:MAG: UDP-4-amino-4,6-dideoxy-N-acetyl-beta-L-altrosamine transaminase [Lentisphaerae bacterium GWF2_44_16]